MFHTKVPGKSFMNREEYRDKVLGCWTGKNIGGTLGAPMEGKRDIFDVTFYTQDLKGHPAPNDDLDLQLVWLRAIEDNGLYRVDERILGEYWLRFITGPWNEYGIGKFNMINGLFPPLSGLCNNGQWKNSNGAWIRSEIWACLFPGEPDEVAPFAWCDACVDHAGDGIYAEIFTAALEAAAFVESDIGKLIEIALARIPADCRVARSVRIAVDEFAAGHDWKTARSRIVEDSADLGWFQAPANVAFTVVGLLWGRGDFGRSICTAVNCGDDTDCTGATCGAVLGILLGRSGIPKEWIEPIGEGIKTVAVNPFQLDVPETLGDLTDRVICCKLEADFENPTLMRLTDGETAVDGELQKRLADGGETAKRVLARSSGELSFPLPYGKFKVEYEKSPVMQPGESQKLRLTFYGCPFDCRAFTAEWQLPEGWTMSPGPQQVLMTRNGAGHSIEVELTAGEFVDVMSYLPVELRMSDRNFPSWIAVPFQQAGAVKSEWPDAVDQPAWDALNRRAARRAVMLGRD